MVLSGTEVTWTVTVTNTGDTTLTNVTVSDPVAPGCATVIESLAAGEVSAPIVCKTTITEDTVNTATVTGIDPLQNTVGPASDTAYVDVVAPELSIVKSGGRRDGAPHGPGRLTPLIARDVRLTRDMAN